MQSIKRPGYYVEGRYYGNRIAQAIARRDWLRTLYGRPIEIESVGLALPAESNRMSDDSFLDLI